MTETSYFWDTPGVGDYQSTYSDDEFSLALLLMFNYDRQYATIAFEDSVYYSLNEHVVDVSGGNFRLYAITALVDGRVYVNDDTITLVPGSGDGYYAVVLRRDASGGAGDQTVRAYLIYNAVAAPTPTQTAATWECVLAQGQVVGGVAQVDTWWGIPLPQNLVLPVRGGEDETDWARTGNETMFNQDVVFIVGVVSVTPAGAAQTISVLFPERFKENSTPYVFVTPVNLSGLTPTHARVIRITIVNDIGFSVTVDLDNGITAFNWIAIGPDDADRF